MFLFTNFILCGYILCMALRIWNLLKEDSICQWCMRGVIGIVPEPVLSHVQLFAVHQAPLSRNFPEKNTGVKCYFLCQGIFLTQGLNPRLLRCRQTLNTLSHIIEVKMYTKLMLKFIILLIIWQEQKASSSISGS